MAWRLHREPSSRPGGRISWDRSSIRCATSHELFDVRDGDRAAAIIEFALVIPIFMIIVLGIISFSRAYQRLNTLSTSLREGARLAATIPTPYTATDVTTIRTKVRTFSTAYGFPIDTTRVNVAAGTNDVTVSTTNYPLFSGLSFLGNLQSITVSRSAVFRLER
ncbi:MAG: TadE/TadG family type IV pilus assembly protein [Gemmatimonadaceae bacterium]